MLMMDDVAYINSSQLSWLANGSVNIDAVMLTLCMKILFQYYQVVDGIIFYFNF